MLIADQENHQVSARKMISSKRLTPTVISSIGKKYSWKRKWWASPKVFHRVSSMSWSMRPSTRRPSPLHAQRRSKECWSTSSWCLWPTLNTSPSHHHWASVTTTTTLFRCSHPSSGSLGTPTWSHGSLTTSAEQWTWSTVSFPCSFIHLAYQSETIRSLKISSWHSRPSERSFQIKRFHWQRHISPRYFKWPVSPV